MSFQIAIDTGGTFTDVVLADPDGRFCLSKAPTTPGRIFDGIGSALVGGREQRDLSMSELLAATDAADLRDDAIDQRDPHVDDGADRADHHQGVSRHADLPRGGQAPAV